MRVFFSISILVLFISCQDAQVLKPVQLDHEFSLKAGDSGILNDIQLSLKVESIKDARCPEGAQCIWEGSAEVILTLEFDKTGILIDTLRTHDKSIIEFSQYSIQLLDVSPFPNLDRKQKTKEARLLIIKY